MSHSGADSPNRSQEASGKPFRAILGLARQITLRMPLEARFEQFWSLLARWLSGGIWRVFFWNSGACSPDGTQEASRGSFSAILEPAGQMALRRPLEAHFEQFWSLLARLFSGGFWKFVLSLLARWLSRGLWRLILRSSGACWPNGSPEAPGGSF